MKRILAALALVGALSCGAPGLLAGCTNTSSEKSSDPGDRQAPGKDPIPEDEPVTDATTAPDFTLPGSDGQEYTLSSFRGKQAVVLAWFPVAFTGGWTAECKSLRESGESIRQFDVAYFAASTDPAEKNQKFAESLDLDFPILSDPGKETARAFGVLSGDGAYAQRWTYYIGLDGEILHVDEEVRPQTHGADVAAKLAELGVARR